MTLYTTPVPEFPSGRFLATIQFWIDVDDAVEAENIAVRVANHAEESNENPSKRANSIQTCVVHKAPFRPIGPYDSHFWAGHSCEDEIDF